MMEMALTMHPISGGTIWDIVTGDISDPKGKSIASSTAGTSTTTTGLDETDWKVANYFAVLTMKENCEPAVSSKIGITKDAYQAYKNLKSHYEGKTVTDLGVLFASVVKLEYDDRSHTIEEHIEEFERKWDFMRATLSTGEFTNKVFGTSLKAISENDETKAEFLLLTLPKFYNTLVENLRTNQSYTYGDIVRQLILYVPGRQKGRRAREGESKENPVVLKTEAGRARDKGDNGKRCDYCISKGWKGLNHTERECFTKKRETKKIKKTKQQESEEEDSDEEGVTIKAIRIGKTKVERKGSYEYDTAATHHTTNEYDRLTNVQHNLQTEVTAYDKSKSICRTMGILMFRHNGRNIRHEQCLYDPTYSNIVSGLQMPEEFIMTGRKDKVELKVGKRNLYMIGRDSEGL